MLLALDRFGLYIPCLIVFLIWSLWPFCFVLFCFVVLYLVWCGWLTNGEVVYLVKQNLQAPLNVIFSLNFSISTLAALKLVFI